MKRLWNLLGVASQPEPERQSPPPPAQSPEAQSRHNDNLPYPTQKQPCGPKCWFKAFLSYPQPPDDEIVPWPGHAHATEDQRREVASLLYKPIHAYQTRIIKLLPASLNTPVCCELSTVDLIALPGLGISSTGDMIAYDCLSYSWGYPVFSHRVLCNGLEVPVIASLYEALRYLRYNDQPRYLWIDAFCINQFDAAEKSRQVRNMLLVYQKCEAVRAWLGMPEGQDRMALRYLQKISGQWQDPNNEGKYHDSECVEKCRIVCADLHGFFSKNFWSRTWIRQEVFASRLLTFHCGPDTCENNVIGNGIQEWQSYGPEAQPDSTLAPTQLPNRDCYEVMRQSGMAGKSWVKEGIMLDTPTRRSIHTSMWMDGLLAGIRFGTTDPRDKVYGVVGMLAERSKVLEFESLSSESRELESFLPFVDYSKPVSLVGQDIVKFLIKQGQNLLPLCVFHDRMRHNAPDPSWILPLEQTTRSWYIASHVTSPQYIQDNDYDTTEALLHYLASDYYGRPPRVDFDVHGVLRCTGYRIGIVTQSQAHQPPFLQNTAVPLVRSIATSPPRPERLRTDFHHFLRSYDELQREANYRETQIQWSASPEIVVAASTEDVNPAASSLDDWTNFQTCDLHALVSGIVQDGDELLLLHGSPLPMVVRHSNDGGDTQACQFLGPACWLWTGHTGRSTKMNRNAPGYTETARMHTYARQHLQEEVFCLT